MDVELSGLSAAKGPVIALDLPGKFVAESRALDVVVINGPHELALRAGEAPSARAIEANLGNAKVGVHRPADGDDAEARQAGQVERRH